MHTCSGHRHVTTHDDSDDFPSSIPVATQHGRLLMIYYLITRMVGPISRRQQFPGREMYAIQLQISGFDVDVDTVLLRVARGGGLRGRYYM